MSQLNLYLPKHLEKRVRAEAKRRNLSISRYVATVLEEKNTPAKGWSSRFFERVAGSWKGPVPKMDIGELEEREDL